jgi:hypothetical protein
MIRAEGERMGIFYDKPGQVTAEYEEDGIIVVHWQNLTKFMKRVRRPGLLCTPL